MFHTILDLALELVTVIAPFKFVCILFLTIILSSYIGPIWLDNLNCPSSAEIIEDCSHPGWGVHNCGHRDDAGVICQPGK